MKRRENVEKMKQDRVQSQWESEQESFEDELARAKKEAGLE